MTGIERLHKLIADIDVNAGPELWYILRRGTEGDWYCEEHDDKTLVSTLVAIASQIERERTCDADTIENVRLIVGGVIDDMERHCLGHEGMEDSPVAQWARGLREALGGDGRDHAADVSVSAYDLLPQEDREAIAWVRDHGGLSHVKDVYHDFRAVVERLGIEWSESELHGLMDALDRRLMPESIEWPRYESGELVVLGDAVPKYVGGGTIKVRSIEFREDATYLREGFRTEGIVIVRPGERVKRPAPKAYDADGAEIRVWDTVYEIKTGERYFVTNVFDGMTEPDFPEHTVECRKYEDVVTHMFRPSQLTHTKPEPVDTWQRIEEDAGCTATKYNERRGTIFTTKQQVARDLVRRCRALAERERGEA